MRIEVCVRVCVKGVDQRLSQTMFMLAMQGNGSREDFLLDPLYLIQIHTNMIQRPKRDSKPRKLQSLEKRRLRNEVVLTQNYTIQPKRLGSNPTV